MSDNTDNQIVTNTVENQNFQQRIRQRAIAAAISVTSEDGATASHANRLAFAGAVFQGTATAKLLAELVCANATVRTKALLTPTTNFGDSVPDSDIDFQLASVWTGVAVSRAW